MHFGLRIQSGVIYVVYVSYVSLSIIACNPLRDRLRIDDTAHGIVEEHINALQQWIHGERCRYSTLNIVCGVSSFINWLVADIRANDYFSTFSHNSTFVKRIRIRVVSVTTVWKDKHVPHLR